MTSQQIQVKSTLVVIAIALGSTGAAGIPWQGDCTALGNTVELLYEAQSSGWVNEADLNWLFLMLDSDDQVTVSLAAYALGHMQREQESIRTKLRDAVETQERLRASSGEESTAASFCRAGLLLLELQPRQRGYEDLYEALLVDTSSVLRTFGSRMLLFEGETDGIWPVLEQIAKSDDQMSLVARETISAKSKRRDSPSHGPSDYVLIEGILKKRLYEIPCLSLMPLKAEFPPLEWRGDCDAVQATQSIYRALREGKDVSNQSIAALMDTLDSNDVIEAGCAAYTLSFVRTDTEAIKRALQERMRASKNVGIEQTIVQGYCRFAEKLIGCADGNSLDSVEVLRALAFGNHDVASVLAIERLLELGAEEGVEDKLRTISSRYDYLSAMVVPILFMLKFPGGQQVYDGPRQFQIIEQVLDGVPVEKLCN